MVRIIHNINDRLVFTLLCIDEAHRIVALARNSENIVAVRIRAGTADLTNKSNLNLMGGRHLCFLEQRDEFRHCCFFSDYSVEDHGKSGRSKSP